MSEDLPTPCILQVKTYITWVFIISSIPSTGDFEIGTQGNPSQREI